MPCWFNHKELSTKVEGITYIFCWDCGKLRLIEKDGSTTQMGYLSPEPIFYEDLGKLQEFIVKLHDETYIEGG